MIRFEVPILKEALSIVTANRLNAGYMQGGLLDVVWYLDNYMETRNPGFILSASVKIYKVKELKGRFIFEMAQTYLRRLRDMDVDDIIARLDDAEVAVKRSFVFLEDAIRAFEAKDYSWTRKQAFRTYDELDKAKKEYMRQEEILEELIVRR